jgi:flagellar biosynthetic protein FliR
MDGLFENLTTDPWGRLLLTHLATGGMWSVYAFLLVSARLAGALILAPSIQAHAIPLTVRVGLVLFLSLIISPTLSAGSTKTTDIDLVSYKLSVPSEIPLTLADFGSVVASEVGLGALFGVGLIAVFSGLRLGGEWLERHSGLGQGTLFNPEWSSGQTACGSIVQLLGIAAFLLIEPIGGDWQLLQSFFQSFQTIPVGSVTWSLPATELVAGVIQQALLLGIRVAIPLVVTMTLVDVAIAFASRGGPPALSVSYLSIRLGLGLLMLAITMTTIPDVVTKTLVSTLELVSGIH